ncbi:hypothetical protein D3C72_2272870 [compost metagenome]
MDVALRRSVVDAQRNLPDIENGFLRFCRGGDAFKGRDQLLLVGLRHVARCKGTVPAPAQRWQAQIGEGGYGRHVANGFVV